MRDGVDGGGQLIEAPRDTAQPVRVTPLRPSLPIARGQSIAGADGCRQSIDVSSAAALVEIGLRCPPAEHQQFALRVLQAVALPPHDLERVPQLRFDAMEVPIAGRHFRLFCRIVMLAARRWVRELLQGVRSNALLIGIYAAFGAVLTIVIGQDVNWDLLNYHFYDAYQLLGGRIARDVDVAGVQTYMNPLFDLPFFASVFWLRLPPIVVGSALGAFHGLALFFVHKIMLAVLESERRVVAHAFGALAAILSAFGAGFLSEIGGTMGDATMAVFVVGAVWFLVSRAGRDAAPSWRSAGWAGLLAGLALGKIVAGIYLLGLGLAIVIVGRSITGRIVRGATFSALAILGAAISMGYWSWLMKIHYGHPAFPYLFKIIAEPTKPVARSFLPRDTTQQTFYPFYFAFRPRAFMVSEVSFNDARLAAAYCAVGLFVIVAGARLFSRRGALRTIEDGRILLLVVCGVTSFFVWQNEVSIYRYAIPLEVLASTLMLGSLAYVFQRRLRAILVAAPICVYLFASAQGMDWGRLNWQSSYFGMDNIKLDQYADSTIFLWEMPNGYLVPYFPKSATFLRLQSNWNRFRAAPVLRTRLEWTVQGANRQKVYLLETNPGADLDRKENALEQLGLTLDSSDCRVFASTLDLVRICAVRYLDK